MDIYANSLVLSATRDVRAAAPQSGPRPPGLRSGERGHTRQRRLNNKLIIYLKSA